MEVQLLWAWSREIQGLIRDYQVVDSGFWLWSQGLVGYRSPTRGVSVMEVDYSVMKVHVDQYVDAHYLTIGFSGIR